MEGHSVSHSEVTDQVWYSGGSKYIDAGWQDWVMMFSLELLSSRVNAVSGRVVSS